MIMLNELLQCDANKGKINLQEVATKLVDATALMGHVAKELSFDHREALSTFLHKDFKQACSRANKVEHMLFGDDISVKIQQFKKHQQSC